MALVNICPTAFARRPCSPRRHFPYCPGHRANIHNIPQGRIRPNPRTPSPVQHTFERNTLGQYHNRRFRMRVPVRNICHLCTRPHRRIHCRCIRHPHQKRYRLLHPLFHSTWIRSPVPRHRRTNLPAPTRQARSREAFRRNLVPQTPTTRTTTKASTAQIFAYREVCHYRGHPKRRN